MNPIGTTMINPPATAATAAQSNAGVQFDSFLRLLTAQIRNQDPLSPMDSTQFVEQLATFSSLEQQVRSNNSLDSIALTISDLHAMLAGQWIGQPVTIESSWVPYSGSPIAFDFDAPVDTDRAVLTVRDPSGAVVSSDELDLATLSGTWSGQSDTGVSAANGTYQFRIDLYTDGRQTGSVAPQLRTTVTSVGTEDGTLIAQTALDISAELTALRKSSGS